MPIDTPIHARHVADEDATLASIAGPLLLRATTVRQHDLDPPPTRRADTDHHPVGGISDQDHLPRPLATVAPAFAMRSSRNSCLAPQPCVPSGTSGRNRS